MNNYRIEPTRRIPISQFNKFHPWPSVQSMRNRIHAARNNSEDREFLDCIEWCTGRVLVNEQKFLRWLERSIERDTPPRRQAIENKNG